MPGREPARVERRSLLPERRRVEDDDVGVGAGPEHAAAGEAEPLRRSAGEPVDRLGQGQHLLLLDAEAQVPRRPGVGAVEDLAGERPVGRHRRRIRAGHAERVGERLALLLLGVGVDDHHQAARIVGRAEQQVVDGVERLLAALGRDRRDVAARVVGPDVVVEQHDAAPVAARAEDALVAAHARAAAPCCRGSRAAATGPRAPTAAAP